LMSLGKPSAAWHVNRLKAATGSKGVRRKKDKPVGRLSKINGKS